MTASRTERASRWSLRTTSVSPSRMAASPARDPAWGDGSQPAAWDAGCQRRPVQRLVDDHSHDGRMARSEPVTFGRPWPR